MRIPRVAQWAPEGVTCWGRLLNVKKKNCFIYLFKMHAWILITFCMQESSFRVVLMAYDPDGGQGLAARAKPISILNIFYSRSKSGTLK